MSTVRLILVEDDHTLRDVLRRELTDLGFEVRTFATAAGVAECLEEFDAQVALVDLRLPGVGGMELLLTLRQRWPDLQVVILTGHGEVPEAVEAMRRGAYDFLTKPTRLPVLEQTLRRASEKHDLLTENSRLRRAAEASDHGDAILGSSPAARELRQMIERVGPTGAAVLVEGENGTGKELVARSLHRHSPRGAGPYVVVNCGGIGSELVESELFGHERGAFTGAERSKTGLFEAAHGGTLLLDEVGELPLAMQPALLRAVQFGEIRPVGSTRTRTVDVRVLAATNRDLAAEVTAGRFREDLFYRLATFQIRVPPLRERRDDLPLLARHFLARASAKIDRRLVLEESAAEALGRRPWPGNIRELENMMIRLSVLARSEVITADDVEEIASGAVSPGRRELPTLHLGELEKLAVAAAMERHHGDKKRAAAELGVALRTLYNKLERPT